MENLSADLKEKALNKIKIDSIKKNDLKSIFELLMVQPQGRTIADLNSLSKIMLTITPIKQIHDISALYYVCKSMYLSKFREKDFVYQKKEQSEALYIVINGKIGMYRKSQDEYEADEVIFMNPGNCFGSMYSWKAKMLPLALQQTLLAIIPYKQFCKIPMQLAIQKNMVIKQLKNAGFLSESIDSKNLDLHQISKLCSYNRLPHGAYIIQQGQTPKGIFLLIKGMVKKVCQVTYKRQQRSLQVNRYSVGDKFPQNICQPVKFNLITQCPSQLIAIPKKALKMINQNLLQNADKKDPQYYLNQMQKKQEWEQYRANILHEVLRQIKNKKK